MKTGLSPRAAAMIVAMAPGSRATTPPPRGARRAIGVPRVSRGSFLAAALLLACGTALFHHRIRVVPVDGQVEVAVFDHRQGYSREWAHRELGASSAARPYTSTLVTTAATTLGSMNDARAVDVALALPALTDEGYFILTVDSPGEHLQRAARFCRYDEYVPQPDAQAIPVTVTATANQGNWEIVVTVDVARAAQSFHPAAAP
jgi:hypothetical protein